MCQLLPQVCSDVLRLESRPRPEDLDRGGHYRRLHEVIAQSADAGHREFFIREAGSLSEALGPVTPGLHLEIDFTGPFADGIGAGFYAAVCVDVATGFAWTLRMVDLSAQACSSMLFDLLTSVVAGLARKPMRGGRRRRSWTP